MPKSEVMTYHFIGPDGPIYSYVGRINHRPLHFNEGVFELTLKALQVSFKFSAVLPFQKLRAGCTRQKQASALKCKVNEEENGETT